MRITTMIKQIVKKNKLALKEVDIDFFMDVAREKKLPLGSEREITAALNILLNSGVFKSK
jgi:lantibiotic modifying enzyme